MQRIKQRLAAIGRYLSLFYPPLFNRLMNRVAGRAYHDGWSNGFDRGHMRGFMDMRSRLEKHRDRYPYTKPADRN